MAMKKIIRPLVISLITVSFIANGVFAFYLFGNWRTLSEWQIEGFGYRLSSDQNPFESALAFSRLNSLTGQYEQLASVSKEINQQFGLLLDEFKQIEGTADLTREKIAEVVAQLELLEASQGASGQEMQQMQSALVEKEQELQQRRQQLRDSLLALEEAQKTIRNQQRILKASPVIRMDNDAYVLQSQFNRLAQVVAEQGEEIKFIQTNLRKGIVSLPVDMLFKAGSNQSEFSDATQRFLNSFVKSMAYLPNASIAIIQMGDAEKEGLASLHSEYSALLAAYLLQQGFAESSLLVASQPIADEQQADRGRIEFHISI